jgi:hypothetical protein
LLGNEIRPQTVLPWGDGSESENTFPLPQMKTSEVSVWWEPC